MNVNSRKNSTLIIAGVGFIFVMIIMYQMFLSGDDYLVTLKKDREDRDDFLKTQIDSPMPPSLQDEFQGIDYFDPELHFRIGGRLERAIHSEYSYLNNFSPFSGNEKVKFLYAGEVVFKYEGKEYRLASYYPNEQDQMKLLIPFRDETNGKSTYGGGRFVELRLLNNDRLDLDFNRALNFPCAYNPRHFCVVPPESNVLPFSVLAGEKDFPLGRRMLGEIPDKDLSPAEYAASMTRIREDKVAFLKKDPESPVPDSLRAKFPGQQFFRPSLDYRVVGHLVKPDTAGFFEIMTNTGKVEKYPVAGTLEFELKGQKHSLMALLHSADNPRALFLPFRDSTSGNTSYGGGRYLDLFLLDGDKVDLDFNQAYNPYCVYNYSFICPVPPEQNYLSAFIEAGEKNFSWEH